VGVPRDHLGSKRKRAERNEEDDLDDGRQPSGAVFKIVDQEELQCHDDRDGSTHEPTVEHLWMWGFAVVGHVV
jgi:hypothetical protein